jgi:hypothetical protein
MTTAVLVAARGNFATMATAVSPAERFGNGQKASAECWLDELNFAALARDQTAGQSPEAKNENRPSVLSCRPLPHARRARHAD